MERNKLKDLLWEYIDSIWQQERWEIKTEEIISKKFWFIQRLVENDKIDTECHKVLHTARAKAEWIWLECQWYSDYESLLMLLSISDTPIDDLISYLK